MSPRSLAVTLSVTLTGTLTATAALAGLAAPASAGVEVRDDPRGDVRAIGARGARSSTDIVRLRGEHEGGALTFTLTLADLDPLGDLDELYAGVRMRTPNGTEFTVMGYSTDAGKEVELYRGQGDDVISCSALEGRFLPAADRITFVVPRSCVQRPQWVRFGAVVGADTTTFYADDARRDGRVDSSGLARLGTRRLQRG